MNDVKHAVIYTRFSPRRDGETSESSDAQEDICRQHARKAGYIVDGAFHDRNISGADPIRPGLDMAIDALRHGGVLLVYKHDRLARDVMLAELIRRRVDAKKATIAAVSGDTGGDPNDPTTRFIRQIMDAVAELERKQIAQRTSHTMRRHQAAGRRMGRYAPYGWRLDPDDPTRMVQDEIEQGVLGYIKTRTGQGINATVLTAELNELHQAASRNGRWNRNTVGKIQKRIVE